MTFTRRDTKIVKSAAVMLMLYHHLFRFPYKIASDIVYFGTVTLGGKSSAYYLGAFGQICVALFLFLGGYGTYLSCKNSRNLRQTIFAKIKGLYLSYWKVFVVFIPLCLLAQVSRVSGNWQEFLLNFVGLSSSYCGEWWFFGAYVILTALYPLFHKLLTAKNAPVLEFLLLTALNVLVIFRKPLYELLSLDVIFSKYLILDAINTALIQTPCFLSGCLFAKYDLLSKLKQRFSGGILHWLGALAVLGMVVCIKIKCSTYFDFLLAPAFSVALILVLEKIPGTFVTNFFEKVGMQSTNIWLIHAFYCYHLIQPLVYLPRYSVVIFFWLLLLCYVSGIVLDAVFAFLGKGCRRLTVKNGN